MNGGGNMMSLPGNIKEPLTVRDHRFKVLPVVIVFFFKVWAPLQIKAQWRQKTGFDWI